MASSDSSAGKPTLPQTLHPPPNPHQKSLDPGITIALFEIGSLPLFCWGSLPSLKNKGRKVTGQQMAVQKFDTVLRELKDILKNVTGFEEKITEAKECFKEVIISEDVSELKGKIRGLGKVNKMLLKNLLFSLNLEKGQNAKNQEMIVEDQNLSDVPQASAKDSDGHSEEKGALNETQLSQEKEECESLHVEEETSKLRDNMEQLLQEAELWSKQHTELSQLLKLYHESQKHRSETQEQNQACFQAQPSAHMSATQELEEQVRKLNHDTYSLHLIAALLENECQILERRLAILRELHQHREGALQDRLPQMNCKPAKENQKPWDAQRAESNRLNMQEMEGMIQKKNRAFRSLDVCLSKKARKNRFNTRVAKRVLVGRKRPASSMR